MRGATTAAHVGLLGLHVHAHQQRRAEWKKQRQERHAQQSKHRKALQQRQAESKRGTDAEVLRVLLADYRSELEFLTESRASLREEKVAESKFLCDLLQSATEHHAKLVSAAAHDGCRDGAEEHPDAEDTEVSDPIRLAHARVLALQTELDDMRAHYVARIEAMDADVDALRARVQAVRDAAEAGIRVHGQEGVPHASPHDDAHANLPHTAAADTALARKKPLPQPTLVGQQDATPGLVPPETRQPHPQPHPQPHQQQQPQPQPQPQPQQPYQQPYQQQPYHQPYQEPYQQPFPQQQQPDHLIQHQPAQPSPFVVSGTDHTEPAAPPSNNPYSSYAWPPPPVPPRDSPHYVKPSIGAGTAGAPPPAVPARPPRATATGPPPVPTRPRKADVSGAHAHAGPTDARDGSASCDDPDTVSDSPATAAGDGEPDDGTRLEPGCVAKAKYSFAARHADEVSFGRGDVLDVHGAGSSPDWWIGTVQGSGGRAGAFPGNYVERVYHVELPHDVHSQ